MDYLNNRSESMDGLWTDIDQKSKMYVPPFFQVDWKTFLYNSTFKFEFLELTQVNESGF